MPPGYPNAKQRCRELPHQQGAGRGPERRAPIPYLLSCHAAVAAKGALTGLAGSGTVVRAVLILHPAVEHIQAERDLNAIGGGLRQHFRAPGGHVTGGDPPVVLIVHVIHHAVVLGGTPRVIPDWTVVDA